MWAQPRENRTILELRGATLAGRSVRCVWRPLYRGRYMHYSWVAPRVRAALDQLDVDRQRLVREYQQLAASFEDGAAGRGKDSWLAAKHYEHFASYLAAYDSAAIRWDLHEFALLAAEMNGDKRRRNWRRWQRYLRRMR
jgi:hypothetical protein